MGRKRIDIKLIENRKNRNSTFKKRRIGLLRKAMELSLLTGTLIQLKIYRPGDFSLVEYFSTMENDFDTIDKNDVSVVKKYHKYFNRDIDVVGNIDDDDINIRLKNKWEEAIKEEDEEENNDHNGPFAFVTKPTRLREDEDDEEECADEDDLD